MKLILKCQYFKFIYLNYLGKKIILTLQKITLSRRFLISKKKIAYNHMSAYLIYSRFLIIYCKWTSYTDQNISATCFE